KPPPLAPTIPAVTILPSAWTLTSRAPSWNPGSMSVRATPPFPKVASSVPSTLYRATAVEPTTGRAIVGELAARMRSAHARAAAGHLDLPDVRRHLAADAEGCVQAPVRVVPGEREVAGGVAHLRETVHDDLAVGLEDGPAALVDRPEVRRHPAPDAEGGVQGP